MIDHIQLIRNVGRFDSVNAAANIALGRLTLIYAENGRGKTTLAAILRSLATGDAIPIVERRRLAAQHPPHVIIGCAGGPPEAMFQNGAWNRTLLLTQQSVGVLLRDKKLMAFPIAAGRFHADVGRDVALGKARFEKRRGLRRVRRPDGSCEKARSEEGQDDFHVVNTF